MLRKQSKRLVDDDPVACREGRNVVDIEDLTPALRDVLLHWLDLDPVEVEFFSPFIPIFALSDKGWK